MPLTLDALLTSNLPPVQPSLGQALEKFKTVRADHSLSQTDNLLLEWTLALVLLELGVVGFVFPVFCGDYEEGEQGGLNLGKFDFECAQTFDDVVPKVSTLAATHIMFMLSPRQNSHFFVHLPSRANSHYFVSPLRCSNDASFCAMLGPARYCQEVSHQQWPLRARPRAADGNGMNHIMFLIIRLSSCVTSKRPFLSS